MTLDIADAITRLETMADCPAKVDLLNDLSMELRDNDTKQALEVATQARAMAEAIGYQAGQGYSIRNIATCLYLLSDFSSALDRGYEALQLFQQLGEKPGVYRALNTIANIYYRLGDNARSLEYDIKMLEIAQEMHDPLTEATALNNIGLVYMGMDDGDNALEYFQRSLDLYTANGHLENVGKPLLNIGIIHRQRKRYDEALAYFNRSLESRQQQPDKHGEALVWYNIGVAHFEKDEFVAAVESYQRCIEIARECGNRRLEADGLLLQARARGRQGATAAGFDQLHQAQQLIDQTGSRSLMPELYLAYAELFERTGDYQRALDHHKKYADAYEQQHSRQVEERLRGLRTSFEADQTRKQNEIYRLKNVELTRANQELEQLNRLIRKGDEYRSKLMEQVAAQSQELERLAKTDGLTGLSNRRQLDETLEREFARAKRYHDPLTVAMLDIDHFKRINDTVSHHAGDEVLKIVAEVLRANSRTVDLVARYGGEEFVMAFPNTTAAAAATVCERIRQAVESFFWTRISRELRVTVSIGLCDDLSLPSHEKLLGAADARMYQAKEQGRNRVVWH
ncbi:MAG: diguanylate cyclase [Rhodocyclaceae bacterium]|nr:diguanylate cyclase [Rhodocyclaceae bacterium]